MKKVCFTFIFGDYDQLEEPIFITEGWEYVVFSDRQHESSVWKTIIVKSDLDFPIQSRLCMICPFLYIDYDLAVSISGRSQVTSNLNQFDTNGFTLLKHPDRDCVYQEAITCINRKKDRKEAILKQVDKYRAFGYPERNGLIATGIIIRRNNDYINEFCKAWFEELKKESFRDQLSFNYVAWVTGFKYETIPFNTVLTQFKVNKHQKNKDYE